MSDQSASSTNMVDKKTPAHNIQYLTAFIVTLGAFSFGTSLGYTSPAGPMLMNNNTEPVSLTSEQNGIFGSVINLGAMVSAPLNGLAISALGRRWTMLGSVAFMAGAWALIGFGQNFGMLVCGRILAGLFIGLTCTNLPSYIGEYASSDIRGTLGTGFQIMTVCGILFAYIMGAVITSWRVLAAVCAIPVVLFFILTFFFVKESPVYLLSKGKVDEAREVLHHFRGKDYNVEPELDIMKDAQEEASRNKVSMKELKAPYILKPIMICVGLMFFQQFSGINAVIFNLSDIFASANSSMDDDINSIIVGVVQVVATLIAAFLCDRLGRKVLLTVSAIAMAISLVALDVFFYEQSVDPDKAAESLGWLPLTSLMLFIAAFSIGYGPIPWVMMGELFTQNVKDAASGISTLANWGSSFIVTLIFAPLQDAIGPYGVYWVFAGVCVINTVFCVMVIPETKGKTLTEITEYFGAPSQSKDRAMSYDNHAYTIDIDEKKSSQKF